MEHRRKNTQEGETDRLTDRQTDIRKTDRESAETGRERGGGGEEGE